MACIITWAFILAGFLMIALAAIRGTREAFQDSLKSGLMYQWQPTAIWHVITHWNEMGPSFMLGLRGVASVMIGLLIGLGTGNIRGKSLCSPFSPTARFVSSGGLARYPSYSSEIDPCQGKSRCLIAYLAPWCPYSKRSMDAINELAALWKDSKQFGMKIIVGSAKQDQLEEMAGGFVTPCYLDPQGSFASQHKISGFPSWIVVDSIGKIIKRDAGSADTAGRIRDQLGF